MKTRCRVCCCSPAVAKTAHNNIQVTRAALNFQGEAAPRHLAEQLGAMEALLRRAGGAAADARADGGGGGSDSSSSGGGRGSGDGDGKAAAARSSSELAAGSSPSQ